MKKPTTHDWQRNRDMWVRVLEKNTGERLAVWNRRVAAKRFKDAPALKAWLTEQGVTGYGRTILVMERFGYPDFFRSDAGKLVDAQYADRPQLRPIYNAIIKAANSLGDVVIQTRKTYVSLLTPRRTFARIVPATKTRVDLGLRLEGRKPGGRLLRSKIHETMPLQVSLASAKEVDKELKALLREAWEENS
jgi:hypothetical protein